MQSEAGIRVAEVCAVTWKKKLAEGIKLFTVGFFNPPL